MKSIRIKILLGFSAVILLTVILAGFNYFATSKSNGDTENIVNEQLPLLIADEKLAFNLAQRIALTRGYVLFGDQSYLERFNEYTEESKGIQEDLLAHSDSEQAQDLVARSVEWREIVESEVFTNYDNGNEEAALAALEDTVTPLGREVMDGFEEMALTREDMIQEEGETVLQSGENMVTIGIIISIAVVIVGIVSALLMANSITKPIKRVVDRMKEIAEGDISQDEIIVKSKDEVSQLAEAINEMQRSLNEVIHHVSYTSDRVSSQSEELTQSANEVKEGSDQIASTMQELSAGAESQANGATDLTDKMSEFVQQIVEANRNGKSVSETTTEVLSMTEEGRQLMKTSIGQMHNIDEIVKDAVEKVKGLDQQSKEISKLVQVIEGIAEQTNLLALNAAIEAARAGEHGKGFAVVADEVRKLAEQVTHSVGDITEIVQNIQSQSGTMVDSLEHGYKEVGEGTKQIEVTGETFETINASVSEVVNKVQSISTNLETIVGNSNDMNASIEEIASVSEESAAGVEQAAASAQQSNSSMEEVSHSADELAQLSEQLTKQVSQFKV
ncbi:methyl-accepting chemotaxis protein [Halobacillus seohaensis]|uniref:Methyl-accepting chemotaxis protein n=1 Tax=Halobacillus seohaensis TaxID=447421 RepID=A0ABW2ER59_9BACI